MAQTASCHNCVYACFDPCRWLVTVGMGWPSRPVCANHPDSLGRMRPTPAGGVCRNYRPRPETPQGAVRQIPLGDGYYAYVDAADYEWLNRSTWHLHGGYAARRANGKRVLMHREIMRPGKGQVVDHRNHSRLDNTRDNLRVSTRQQNTRNAAKRRGTSSRFKGVYYRKDRSKWAARTVVMGRHIFLGIFHNEVAAARAYDRAAVAHFGEYASLNFPEEWPPERRAEVRGQQGAAKRRAKDGGRKTEDRGPRPEGGAAEGRVEASERSSMGTGGTLVRVPVCPGDGGQRPEGRERRTGIRGQKTEGRGQRTAGQKQATARKQKAESEVNKAEGRGKRPRAQTRGRNRRKPTMKRPPPRASKRSQAGGE